MDVKLINPFLHGTLQVMDKMVSVQPIAGKPFVKTDDTACGDISGIIGMTGDAIGSLALTFNEDCIIYIVNRMLAENHKQIDREVLDAVGELANMISGVARKLMEKDDFSVFAAIPSVVFGKTHTIRHVLKGPSIVIPFQTENGQFVIDVCLEAQARKKDGQPPAEHTKTDTGRSGPNNRKPAVFANPSMPKAGPEISQDKINKDLSGTVMVEQNNSGDRITKMKELLAETSATRDAIMKLLEEQPFIEWQQRQRYKKALPAYDTKIKRLKLDVAAAETIAKLSKDDLENPHIKPHFQHYVTSRSPKVNDK
jgi:chemotaxis protein CheX